MATYDPQRARRRGREATPDVADAASEPAPVDLLLGAAPEPVVIDEPVVVDEPTVIDEPVVPDAAPAVGTPTSHDPHDHASHEHGPDCDHDHDHGGIDVRVLAAAGVAAALTVMGIVRARRRRSA